jgi:hypothetical protein
MIRIPYPLSEIARAKLIEVGKKACLARSNNDLTQRDEVDQVIEEITKQFGIECKDEESQK